MKRVDFFGSIFPTFIDEITTAAKLERSIARNKLSKYFNYPHHLLLHHRHFANYLHYIIWQDEDLLFAKIKPAWHKTFEDLF